ncbi:hypothetical protein H5410_051317 [Solanum commersonii]|uniref:Uncharacterized protein n=1 Tax=Solanum commersonii TaxID=4109 RepID=A0A9J5WY32_SOLCO|nr:hypothetical protein H5410_051317 [Solanum commersonii]
MILVNSTVMMHLPHLSYTNLRLQITEKLCLQMFTLQHTAFLFQVPRNRVSPQWLTYLSSPIRSPFHFLPNQSSSQRAKTTDFLTLFEEEDNNDADGVGDFQGREDDEKNYDKDPELADILGTCLDDPDKAKSRLEERLRKKRNKIVHTKTGSPTPMTVEFNKFDYSNTYIWFEFYNAPLEKDISLICDTIRSWHIVGRLGGCNSMNMQVELNQASSLQLSQSPLDKRPNYDAVQGANVTPTTFYNIGDVEIQDNLARIWVDIGTSEPLLLDVLINALSQISSDYVGIKQVVFGGSEFENWKENLTSEDAGYSVYKI